MENASLPTFTTVTDGLLGSQHYNGMNYESCSVHQSTCEDYCTAVSLLTLKMRGSLERVTLKIRTDTMERKTKMKIKNPTAWRSCSMVPATVIAELRTTCVCVGGGGGGGGGDREGAGGGNREAVIMREMGLK